MKSWFVTINNNSNLEKLAFKVLNFTMFMYYILPIFCTIMFIINVNNVTGIVVPNFFKLLHYII